MVISGESSGLNQIMSNNNFVIIGMPGSGKSTFGKKLATAKGLGFVDTDKIIEKQFGSDLETVVKRRGLPFMRALEEQTVCDLSVSNSVIAPGGSVVYGERAMQHLRELGTVVYIEISLPTMLQRVSKNIERGLFKLPSMSLQELYCERKNLYERWADITLDNNKPLTALQFDVLLQQLATVRPELNG